MIAAGEGGGGGVRGEEVSATLYTVLLTLCSVCKRRVSLGSEEYDD